ncbi:uncharacterized protein LOC125235482 isoform X2 [Leguminivora glycinivorella]|uniref:uncharacterized protein LOC125235482 isoform X2 n=1 Tax=Leguminivora glycinivorella TaxID=1035111 RepID=UPI00200D63D5|nr:uncharacterized protein LOC125235482 isoform X2 [Leguminivora glycinivorella]
MRPLLLLLALAALLAPAHFASIATPEKKLGDPIKDVLDTEAQKAPEEPIDQANTIKDIDNQLLKKAEPIPVKVVVEDVAPVVKDSEDTVKRVEIDLKHPGEPQRQEHETQNPEHFEHEPAPVATIKQMIQDTQEAFNQRFKAVSECIGEWLLDNKPEISLKDSIQDLQETFMENIEKVNATIQSYWDQTKEDSEKKVEITKMQSGLKVLEEKFETGVKDLNNGVRNLAVLKETRDDASSTTAKPPGIQFPGFVTNFWTSVTNGFSNVTNQFQNIIGQGNNSSTGAVGVQSDETSASTSKPTVFQAIQNQIQGIFQGRPQGTQSDEQPGGQTGPFAQVIQNVPLLQNFVNFIQPKPQEPSKQPAQSTNSAGSNVVPADPAKPSDQQQKKPEEASGAAPAPAPAAAATAQGPIQQIIQRNPIVQGIAGAVQKIQHTINNPEKPREGTTEEKGDVKAGFFPYYGYGHRPHRPSDVAAWQAFVTGLIGSIGATINGTATTISTAVNSAINTIGSNIETIISSTTG